MNVEIKKNNPKEVQESDSSHLEDPVSNPNSQSIVILALYQFIAFPRFANYQAILLNFCKQHELKGTLLIAAEGLNGTLAGKRDSIDQFCKFLVSGKLGVIFDRLEAKESYAHVSPFLRMKVKLKKEIVTLGVDYIDPNKNVGHYVNSEGWNELISDPDTLVIDTRNDYEYDVGTFSNAVNPNTRSFRDFPEFVEKKLDLKKYKHKKIAMFCTGGIRCEKATGLLIEQGFQEVYHLQGGILKYLEETSEEDSLWEGECFVFDDRVTVTSNLEPGSYDMCHGCRRPITEDDKQSEVYIKGVSCPYCSCEKTNEQKERYAERQKQMDLADQRNEAHLGTNPRELS